MARRVQGVLVDADDFEDAGSVPGAFTFAAHDAGVFYICPCGCGQEGYLRLRPSIERPSWAWDGNRAKPTLTPSIHHLIDGKTHWHGWLRAGVFEDC